MLNPSKIGGLSVTYKDACTIGINPERIISENNSQPVRENSLSVFYPISALCEEGILLPVISAVKIAGSVQNRRKEKKCYV